MLTRVPTPNSTYYPTPYYGLLFRGKWYNIKQLIGMAKEAKLKNNAPIKYQIEIPFIVWCSDKWKLSHQAEWETIGKCIDRAFTTDNLCHLLFRLAGIKTKVYQAERDLFSPEFVPQTKEYNMLSL